MSSPIEMLSWLEERLNAFAESYTAGYSYVTLQTSLPVDFDRADRYARGLYKNSIRERALSLQAYQSALLAAVCVSNGSIPAARSYAMIGKSLAREAHDPIAETYAMIRRAAIELHHGILADALTTAAAAVDQGKTIRERRPDLYAWALSLFTRAAAIRVHTRAEMDEAYRKARRQALALAGDLPAVNMTAFTVTGPQVIGAVGDAASDAGDADAVDLIEQARSAYPAYSRLIADRTDLNMSRALVRTGDVQAGVDLAVRTLEATAQRGYGPVETELRDRAAKVIRALPTGQRDAARALSALASHVA